MVFYYSFYRDSHDILGRTRVNGSNHKQDESFAISMQVRQKWRQTIVVVVVYSDKTARTICQNDRLS